MGSTLAYDPFHPPGASCTHVFVADHPAYRQAQKKPSPAPATKQEPGPFSLPGPARPSVPVLLPVRASNSPKATSSFTSTLAPPGARPEQIQCYP